MSESTRPPGVVIDVSPDFARQFIGSPGLAVLPDGAYVASHDWFGPGTTLNVTSVFVSKDRGATWKPLATVHGQWWSSLFFYREALYLFGTSREYGNLVVRRSRDGGKSWTSPDTEQTGLLAHSARYHTAPVPVIEHAGRLWRAAEDAMAGGGWGREFRAFIVSAPAESDLLNAANWTFTNRLHLDPGWVQSQAPGWLEGNAVVAPDGSIVDVLRVNESHGDRAAIVHVSADRRTLAFDPITDFIDFPGGLSKFTIRFDPVTHRYWSLVNKSQIPLGSRNLLCLTSSADLRHWKVERAILSHPDPHHHSWQYIDWLFDGDDIIFVSRTGWDGSHNYHDANYLTFHRIKRMG